MSLALLNAEQHAGRVDVVDAEAVNLTETNAGRVEDRENDAVAKRANGGEKSQKLVDGENDRQMTLAMTERDALNQSGSIEDVQIEEAQGADALVVPAVRDLLHVADEEQVLLNVGTPEPVGRAAEMSGKAGNHLDVDVDHERSPFSEIESVDHPGSSPGRMGGNGPASAGSLNHAKRAARAASFNYRLQPTSSAAHSA